MKPLQFSSASELTQTKVGLKSSVAYALSDYDLPRNFLSSIGIMIQLRHIVGYPPPAVCLLNQPCQSLQGLRYSDKNVWLAKCRMTGVIECLRMIYLGFAQKHDEPIIRALLDRLL